MAAAGAAFASTRNLLFLIIAGTIGVISPSGNEVGPFLSIEQASLSHIVPAASRTEIFAWYTLAGSMATALGALAGGGIAQALQHGDVSTVASYRAVVICTLLSAFYWQCCLRDYRGVWKLLRRQPIRTIQSKSISLACRNPAVSCSSSQAFLPWTHSRRLRGAEFRCVLVLSALRSETGYVGAIFFWANVFAGISALLASRLAARIGLVRTMVFTHLPSNVLLILVPLMPTLPLAIAVLLARFSISQMDVPARQSYTMAVVQLRSGRGRRNHRRGAHYRRGREPTVCRDAVRHAVVDQRSVLSSGRVENCLRLLLLLFIPASSAAGRRAGAVEGLSGNLRPD